jgi:hypothetical protein
MNKLIKQPMPSWIMERAEQRLRDERIKKERAKVAKRYASKFLNWSSKKQVDQLIKDFFSDRVSA